MLFCVLIVISAELQKNKVGTKVNCIEGKQFKNWGSSGGKL